MASILDKIVRDTALIVKAQKQALPLAELKNMLDSDDKRRGFRSALLQHSKPAIIAEIKKASPSRGLIRADFKTGLDAALIAKAYQKGGAACLSVLTDEKYFQGDISYLGNVRAAVDLPLLRKDFMIDEYQIYHSYLLGADCILLIMACLSDNQAKDFHTLATSLGLDVLVEVHDAEELQRALTFAPNMIGINNRNLKTLEVDLATTEKLAKYIPDDCLLVSESGLEHAPDLQRMAQANAGAGAGAFLIGESLMKHDNITQAIQTLRTGFNHE
ncbi:MAG: indole-3-glycerol phosphate synthase TrpC [Alphaproteobacteria bacterium]|nr:indole-3-glycerol phosphate synthase TrpC [Alphaproteobacteria bacterium]